jgi:hypothetical protein
MVLISALNSTPPCLLMYHSTMGQNCGLDAGITAKK